MNWTRLGRIPPDQLVDARLQLHWAAQVAASVGFTFASPQPDWSHTSLVFNVRKKMLMGPPVGSGSARAGLDLASCRIVIVQSDRDASFDLRGRTLEEAYRWTVEQCFGIGLDGDRVLIRPNHAMPDHAVGSGGMFDVPDEELRELSSWFENANEVLATFALKQENASPVRCWPHHFDIATLISLSSKLDSESARTIGVGMSPGDKFSPAPYFYVTPWPYPDAEGLPELPLGEWNRNEWVGAVLSADTIVRRDDAAEQHHATAGFLETAADAARIILEN